MGITPAEIIIDIPAELEEALIELAPALPASAGRAVSWQVPRSGSTGLS